MDNSKQFFPLPSVFRKTHHEILSKLISNMEPDLSCKSGEKYYTYIVESANKIEDTRTKIESLLEAGNLAAINGYDVCYKKALNYLLTITDKMDTDSVLSGLKYECLLYFLLSTALPNIAECCENGGSLAILINLAYSIKEGNESKKRELHFVCELLLETLKAVKRLTKEEQTTLIIYSENEVNKFEWHNSLSEISERMKILHQKWAAISINSLDVKDKFRFCNSLSETLEEFGKK